MRGSVYVISVYRAAPGHRDQLEKSLSQTRAGDTASGTVLMQHVEGGPWQFLAIVRYNSWQDFAAGEKTSVADTLQSRRRMARVCANTPPITTTR